jgi:ribonuclease VapC
MAKVLDSSAVLAFLRDEPGTAKVRSDLPAGFISAVNASEILSVLVRNGLLLEDAELVLRKARLQVREFSLDTAVRAASLSGHQFRSRGLSLGDCICPW